MSMSLIKLNNNIETDTSIIKHRKTKKKKLKLKNTNLWQVIKEGCGGTPAASETVAKC
jgi:hypothetical protein